MAEWRRRWFHRFLYRRPALVEGEVVLLESAGLPTVEGGTYVLTNQRLLLVGARRPRPMYAVPAGTSAWKLWAATRLPGQTAIRPWNIIEVGALEPKRWYTRQRPFDITLRSGRTVTIRAQSAERLHELLVEACEHWTRQRAEWETMQSSTAVAPDATSGGT